MKVMNAFRRTEHLDSITDNKAEICDDVRDECSKYGTILEIKVPRPAGGSRQSAGVGRIFVKFETAEATTIALNKLAGRKFADRTVVTTYFTEVRTNITPGICFIFVANNLCRRTLMLALGKIGQTVQRVAI